MSITSPNSTRAPRPHNSSFIIHNYHQAFTILELLVVISIIGLMAALAVPALKNLGKSNVKLGAARQILDDLGRARQFAISQRTTVYMIFLPTNYWDTTYIPAGYPDGLTNNLQNLADKQLTGYAFVTLRSIGDQPGQGTTNYLGGWQALPDNNFIAQWKFMPRTTVSNITDIVTGHQYNIPGFNRMSLNYIPFPFASTVSTNPPAIAINLPYIAFNYQGQLTTEQTSPLPNPQDEYIPLATGSVIPAIDTSTRIYETNSPTVTETPAGNSYGSSYNLIHINWLTGRARQETQQVQ